MSTLQASSVEADAPRTVTVYAASSAQLQPYYLEAAAELGSGLAQQGYRIVYGGGRAGLMGALADAALAAGAEVVGIMPEFLRQREVAHSGLSQLLITADMRTRKQQMLEQADAVIALPGGCGTLEELFEAITMKRLGLFNGAIVVLNTAGYYADLLTFLQHACEQKFMLDQAHTAWQVAADPEEAIDMLATAISQQAAT